MPAPVAAAATAAAPAAAIVPGAFAFGFGSAQSTSAPIASAAAIPTGKVAAPAASAGAFDVGFCSASVAASVATTQTQPSGTSIAAKFTRTPLGLALGLDDTTKAIVVDKDPAAGTDAAAQGVTRGVRIAKVAGESVASDASLLTVQGMLRSAVARGVSASTPLEILFSKTSTAPSETDIVVRFSKTPLGIQLTFNAAEQRVVVDKTPAEGTEAFAAGIRAGMAVVKVGESDVQKGASNVEVQGLLKSAVQQGIANHPVTFRAQQGVEPDAVSPITKPVLGMLPESPSSPAPTPARSPSTHTGPTTVRFSRAPLNIQLKQNTVTKGVVVDKTPAESTEAYAQGIRAGMAIVRVGSVDVQPGASVTEVQGLLRTAIQQGIAQFPIVFQQPGDAATASPDSSISVVFNGWPLGLTFAVASAEQKRSLGCSVVIDQVKISSEAYGKANSGDGVLFINSSDVHTSSHEEVNTILYKLAAESKTVTAPVQLKLTLQPGDASLTAASASFVDNAFANTRICSPDHKGNGVRIVPTTLSFGTSPVKATGEAISTAPAGASTGAAPSVFGNLFQNVNLSSAFAGSGNGSNTPSEAILPFGSSAAAVASAPLNQFQFTGSLQNMFNFGNVAK
jgi:hypothetical protein